MSDDEEGGACNVCGGPLRYGGRHRKCGEAVMAAEAAERERSRIDQQDLALMIGRLVTALRKARPMAPQDLDFKAIDLLRRKGLAPSPLREQAPAGEKT